MSSMTQDMDKTVFLGMDAPGAAPELPPSIRPVTASGMAAARSLPYVAQQTSLDQYTPGLNPLVNAASELLLSVVRIRSQGQDTDDAPGVHGSGLDGMEDMEVLRARLEAEIRAFETQALASADIEQSQVIAARYVLCTAVDEAVSISLSGENGQWARHALLSTFHNETWGGEKFFQILDRCMQQPARNLYILELMYLLLSLGFEGKYAVRDRGPIALEALRDKIYKQMRLLRGEAPQDLSKKLEPAKTRNRVYAYVPLWLVIVVVLFCMGVTFWGFSTTLDRHAAPLLERLAGGPGVAAGALETAPEAASEVQP